MAFIFLAGVIGMLVDRLKLERRVRLGKAQRVGCVSGGCFLPVILFIVAGIAGDVGGPLFWPILAVFGAVVGFAGGTLFALLFQRDK